ncbi:hypothetical protein AKJ66_03415 [candidate division MSBL1 archaeon SCGC-AAA259E22]|uniref:Adenine deaminase n=1 Tax=candidate division MSBL1 archaeon SCGC-AAA259E22 TaxID=1698265 RepID=A0A133UF41_9EURY|nr:hypothetical protein AKJ66_03415 [candidate division MSBL1 archaeon SCGC-AAA259E22]
MSAVKISGELPRELIQCAKGEVKADLVLKNSILINVCSGELLENEDIAIKKDRIALVGDADHTIGEETFVIDAGDYYVSPGLIDVHNHIEASMVNPTQFARVVLPKGNTAVLWEPLWTANVLGKEGVKIFLEEGRKLPLKFYATAPSGVPGAPPEIITPGHELSIGDTEEMLSWDNVVGLGEIVELKEVLEGDKKVHEKMRLALRDGKTIDGSGAGMEGKELNAYVAAGVQSDHEATKLKEALERIRLGLRLVIREGSGMRDLSKLITAITEEGVDSRRCCFCVDDKDIGEVGEEGLIDYMVRKSIASGVDPVEAVQIASLNAAEYMKVDGEIGSVTPGKKADLLMVKDLEKFSVDRVIVDGEVVSENGKLMTDFPSFSYPQKTRNSVRVKRKITREDFIYGSEKETETKVRVIEVYDDKIISSEEIETLPVENGEIRLTSGVDILKAAVVERYGKTGPNIGKGFVKGFGLEKGAIATSITPDIHHLITIGRDEVDMSRAVNRIVEIRGGIVISEEGEILDELSLPIGGIVSDAPYEKIIEKLENLRGEVRKLGCELSSPFMTLAFVGCPTLPELKLSDKGLVDVFENDIRNYEEG